jgi:uncharacterized tellurite resistance protein B-like protein
MAEVLADGKIDSREVESLTALLYADGVLDREEADFLVLRHKRVARVTPAFEKFVYRAIRDHVLTDGRIDSEEAAWLRQVVFADGEADEREKKLIRELRGQAGHACPEFEALDWDCAR